MAPRKQRPGYVAEGELLCRRHSYDPETRRVTKICNKPVPAGELPHLALNSPSGDYLQLCTDCREELYAQVAEWVGASFGTARLVAELLPLSDGQLVSETELKERLAAIGQRDLGKKGPLTPKEREIGLALVSQKPPRWGSS